MKIRKPTKLDLVNVPKVVCDHMLGKHHTFVHRLTIGVVVMTSGVLIAKIHVDYVIVHVFLDGVGYLLHGIGAIPIVERIIASYEID